MANDPAKEFRTKQEVVEALGCRALDQQRLFEAARRARSESSGNAVTIRGLIELSSYCQKKCSYCAMRCVNTAQNRFRLTREDVIQGIENIRRQGIHTVFLQSGQDPTIDPMVESLLEEMEDKGVKVILCLGERELETYRRFAERGAQGYVIKFESSDEKHFAEITHRSLESRLQCIKYVREAGMLLGTGFISGLPGQDLNMLANDIMLCAEIRPEFVSVSPFIPNENTPFENEPVGDVDTALNSLALLRILLPQAHIPTVSAFEKLRKGGQLDGLNAGANVITVNFTPPTYRDKYPIYSKERFVVSIDHARDAILRAGLGVGAESLRPMCCQPDAGNG